MAEDDTPDDDLVVDLTDDEPVDDPVDEPDADADADEPADPDAPDDPAAAAPSRRDTRIQSLSERNRQLAAEQARLTRELDQMRRSQPQPAYQPPAETPAQRAERLALLSPEDRIRTELHESQQAFEQRQQQMLRTLQDQTDITSFESLAARNPLAAKMRDEVEQALQGARARGQDLPRYAVFTYLVGQKALAQQGKGNRAARRNQQRQAARPAAARGDVSSSRQRTTGDTAGDFEKRFGDVPI